MANAPRITTDKLNTRMQAGEGVVPVDVRRGSYDESDVKIKGAIRMDPDAYKEEYRRIPAGSRVVTYCT